MLAMREKSTEKGKRKMAIRFIEDKKLFRLDAGDTTYIMQIGEADFLKHVYYGAHISDDDTAYLVSYIGEPFHPNPIEAGLTRRFSLDAQPQEYSVNGVGDFRISALSIRDKTGCSATKIIYKGYRIIDGKPELDGMPSTYLNDDSEAKTLEIDLEDRDSGAVVTLVYTAFEKLSVITRHARIKNCGDASFNIESAHSLCLDFYGDDFELIHLYGKWAAERFVERVPLTHAITEVSSKKGSSGHNHNPFAAIVKHDTTEDSGDAYGISLVYSGSFAITAEVQHEDTTRILAGINPHDFSWKLDPGECFTTPEAVLVYTNKGIGEMSRIYHRLYNKNLCRGYWRDNKRPILINNWEATYFDFNEDKLYEIAKGAAALGIEMLVMDDGWFSGREGEFGGLGDWEVNTKLLPNGIKGLAERINSLGMKLGVWFEPEMVSSNSKVYMEHPDWVIHAGERSRTLDRNQMILDLSREEVVDFVYNRIAAILDNANVEYIKWDFNRNLTEIGSAALPPEKQGEAEHRYILGLYALLDRLMKNYPKLLLEGCSGGGGRFDPAMLCYSPQIWTSDDTDPLERCKIQYGTSYVYPASAMSAHVSASPCHQTHRASSFVTRGNVAMAGSFGYELDLNKLCDEEKEEVKRQVARYHEFYNCIHYGDFYRLVSPFDKKGYCAWNYVSENKDEAILTFVIDRDKIGSRYYVKLKGLCPDKKYRDTETGRVYFGDTLMNAGLNLTNKAVGDLSSKLVHFVEEK